MTRFGFLNPVLPFISELLLKKTNQSVLEGEKKLVYPSVATWNESDNSTLVPSIAQFLSGYKTVNIIPVYI